MSLNTPSAPSYRTTVKPKVYLVGDSMTETGFHWQNGWGLELTRRYLRWADVLNRGLGGYTSRSIRALLQATGETTTTSDNKSIAIAPDAFLPAAREKVAFCVLFLGTNDASAPDQPSHVPIQEFEENYRSIARNLLQRSQHGIVCVLPPPEYSPNLHEWLKEFLPMAGFPPLPDEMVDDGRNSRIQEYGNVIRQIALKLEQEEEERSKTDSDTTTDASSNKTKFCAVIDAYQAFRARYGDCSSTDVLCDGLHFGEKGHDLMTELLWNELTARGLGVSTTENNAVLAQKLWKCPSPTWFLDEVGASSEKMPRSEPTYTAWW